MIKFSNFDILAYYLYTHPDKEDIDYIVMSKLQIHISKNFGQPCTVDFSRDGLAGMCYMNGLFTYVDHTVSVPLDKKKAITELAEEDLLFIGELETVKNRIKYIIETFNQ